MEADPLQIAHLRALSGYNWMIGIVHVLNLFETINHTENHVDQTPINLIKEPIYFEKLHSLSH